MTETLIITNKPFWARLLAPFWVLETAAGLGFAWIGVNWLGAEENGIAWVMMIGGVLLAVAGVVMAALSWRVARLQGPALELSGDGLLDRRLSPHPIPWQAIAWKVVFNGRSYSLQFDVAAPHRQRLTMFWEQRVMGALNRAFGFPEFTVVTLGTGMSAHGLGRAFAGYKPPA